MWCDAADHLRDAQLHRARRVGRLHILCMIHEFARPVAVKTPLGLGSVWYVESQGAYFNNIYAVILEDTGETRYMRSDQFVVLENPTMDIKNLGAAPV